MAAITNRRPFSWREHPFSRTAALLGPCTVVYGMVYGVYRGVQGGVQGYVHGVLPLFTAVLPPVYRRNKPFTPLLPLLAPF